MAILMIAQGSGILVLMNVMDLTIALIIGPPLALLGFIIVWYGFLTMSI
ncbi:MAG: hypothetical protein ACTSQJ_19350 [Promethearchaeota archaeon]